MSKAENAFAILINNLGPQDMLDLIDLLSGEVERISQEFMKDDQPHDPVAEVRAVRLEHEVFYKEHGHRWYEPCDCIGRQL